MAPVMTVYGTDNTSAPLTVELESYNGDMKFSFGEDSADITSGLKKFEMGDSADLNEVLESNNMTKFSIEYWTDRELLGWNVLETDDASVEEPDWQYVMKQNDAGNMEELMISTEEMLNYQFGSKSLRFEAVWAGNDSYYYSEVRLYDYDCNTGVYWGDDETNVSYWSDSSYMLKDPRHLKDTDSYGNPVNRKIVEQEEAAELQNLVVHGEYVGWIKFDKAQNGDGEEPGYEYNDFDSEGNEKYYTTSEVLNSNVPEDDVLFVVVRANENIGVGTYIDNINEMINGNWSSGNGGGENNDPRIEVEGNGGTFTVTIAGETSDPQEQKAFFLSEDHQTIGDCLGDAEISTPNYWTDREFSGWIAYKKYADYDEEGNEISSWREPLYEEPLPLSEALKYSINPNNVYYLVAEWGGMESDYYSYMSVDPYYGSFDVYHGDEITEENKEIVDYPWRDSLAVKKDGVSTFDDMWGSL